MKNYETINFVNKYLVNYNYKSKQREGRLVSQGNVYLNLMISG